MQFSNIQICFHIGIIIEFSLKPKNLIQTCLFDNFFLIEKIFIIFIKQKN